MYTQLAIAIWSYAYVQGFHTYIASYQVYSLSVPVTYTAQ